MKRIIVCCDGTWNADDTQTNDTNVALLARAIYGSQQTDVLQIGLYLRGVGTTGLKLETWIEGTTGIGVDGNIRSAYQFIGQNYVPGDEIYLCGFSRGAFIRPEPGRPDHGLWHFVSSVAQWASRRLDSPSQSRSRTASRRGPIAHRRLDPWRRASRARKADR